MTPIHSVTEKIPTLKRVGKSEKHSYHTTQPLVQSFLFRMEPSTLSFSQRCTFSTPTFKAAIWETGSQITYLWELMSLSICKSPRPYETKRQLCFTTNPTLTSSEGAGENSRLPVFPWMGFHCILSQLRVKLLISLHLGADWDPLGAWKGCWTLALSSPPSLLQQ